MRDEYRAVPNTAYKNDRKTGSDGKILSRLLFVGGISLLYLMAFLLQETMLPACILLLLAGTASYPYYLHESGTLISLPGLLGLFWFGGEGLACLKLSRLSSVWETKTWIAFYLFYVVFLIGYDLEEFLYEKLRRRNKRIPVYSGKTAANRLFICIVFMTAVSVLAFCVEAVKLGFIPALLRDTPHAYSYFHVTGVHYFTVSSVFVHPLSILWWMEKEKDMRKRPAVVLCNLAAILVPILCVSRYFLIMSVAMSFLVYLAKRPSLSFGKALRLLLGLVILMIPLYFLLTVFRSHSVSYLNSIFEMKDETTPIYITQPYMYITNNYENFNCLVRDVGSGFKHGLRQLFPFLAVTGLKFVVPFEWLSTTPDFITKTELTTVTILYDAYYDFGLIGTAAFGMVLGLVSRRLSIGREQSSNPIILIAYGQFAMYLILSFFTTWFSNPTTWFWFALTFVFYLFVKRGIKPETVN